MSPSRKPDKHQEVPTWAVILIAAAVTGARPTGWFGRLGSPGPTNVEASDLSPKGQVAHSARLPPRSYFKYAMIEPPAPRTILRNALVTSLSTPTQTGPGLSDELFELPRPPLRC